MDPRDFISLTSFGTVGSLLFSLGLLGCLLHRHSSRIPGFVVVALTGGLMIFDGAQIFHGTRPSSPVSLAVLIAGSAIVLSLKSLSTSVPDGEKPAEVVSLPETQNHSAGKLS